MSRSQVHQVHVLVSEFAPSNTSGARYKSVCPVSVWTLKLLYATH